MSIFPQKNSYLINLPDNWSPEGYRQLPICIPDDDQWEIDFYSNFYRLALQHIWARDETREGAKTVAKRWREAWAYNRVTGGCIEEKPPFYESEDDADGYRNNQKTYELVGDFLIEGFIMTFIGPLGVVAYRVINRAVKFLFGTTIGGAVVRILINSLEYGVYLITDDANFASQVVDVADFLIAMGAEFVPDQTPVWIEIEEVPQIEQAQYFPNQRFAPTTGRLQIGRGNIRVDEDDMTNFRLRQSGLNPLILQQTWDKGETWTKAYDFGALDTGGTKLTHTETIIYNEKLIELFNQTIVNNTTINKNTEYDGTINDQYKRDALCLTLEQLVVGYQNVMESAPTGSVFEEKTWISLALVGAGLTLASAFAPVGAVWGTYIAVGGGFVGLTGAIVEAMAVFGVGREAVDEVTSDDLDDYLCIVINNLNYPVTQAGLGQAFSNAFDDLPATTDKEKYIKSLAQGFKEYMGTREMYSTFVNVWGDTALAMQAVDATYDGCLCWTKICKNPSPYQRILTPYAGNVTVKRATIDEGGVLIGGQSSRPVTGGQVWDVGVNYEIELDNPIARIDTVYIPSTIEGSNAGNGVRTIGFYKGSTLRRGYNTFQLNSMNSPPHHIEIDISDNPIMDVDRIISHVGIGGMSTETIADGQSVIVDTNKMVICGVYPA